MVALAVLGSCGGKPHIHNSSEFDRESEFYRNGWTDRSSVDICYAKSETTAKTVAQMAVAECGRFGKTAVFSETSYNLCPLTTPVAARYRCLTKEEMLSSKSQDVGS